MNSTHTFPCNIRVKDKEHLWGSSPNTIDNSHSTTPTYPNNINPEVPETHDKRGSVRNLADGLHDNEYIWAHVAKQVVNVNRLPAKGLHHIDRRVDCRHE